MSEKLTKAALSLLKRLDKDDQAVGPRGAAAIELRRGDLAEWDGQSTQTLWWLKITDAGRAALKTGAPQ